LKEEFNIKMKNLEAYVRNEFKAQGSGNSVVHNHYTTDSTGKRYPYWELKATDGYLDFRASVYDSLHAPYTYSYSDTITTAIAVKKKWLGIGRDKLYATSMLKNPNAKVVGTTNLLVDHKDKRFGVMVFGGYDPFHNQVVGGVGVGYTILKL
jgi:dihydropteroate synthase